MRLRTALAAGATLTALAPAALTGAATPAVAVTADSARGPAGPAASSAAPVAGGGADTSGGTETIAVPGRQPTCGNPTDTAFPIRTRITGGPTAYVPGGGFGTWRVELTNTTSRACGNIHPVIVFTDRSQSLQPSQIQLEFYDGEDPTTGTDGTGRTEGTDGTEGMEGTEGVDGTGATAPRTAQPGQSGGRPHPVTVERTDRNELVGVLDDGFPGYTVPPGRTVTVPVRLAFTSDTRPDEVTANAAIVQRRGDDGDWVGESGDYRFTVRAEERPPATDGSASRPPAPGVAEELPRTGLDALILAGASAVAFALGAGAQLLVGRLRARKG
ncbi:hypothetical protein [Streptomyces sp. NRRL S-118]|uniref:hypothetical protein n=1 Tax=Streptomyces sp. NRRL S-118 TaxID=1463881 RepID=UPI0006948F63|nr:hypothetical protein [Streptomyces sp. NRRL S-118]